MTIPEIKNEIEEIKAEIKKKGCCENTDDLSDRAAFLHRELRKLNEANP